MLLVFSYFIIYIYNYPYLSLQILFIWFVISQSGGHYSHIMASSLTWMSLIPSIFLEERIKVGKEEAGTSAFNQAYNKFQANQEKAQTRYLLDLERRKVHGRIKQW